MTTRTDISAPPAPVSTLRLDTGRAATVGLLLAAYVAMAELDRLAGESLDDRGRTWPFAVLFGPGGFFNISGWTVPGFTNDQGHIGAWLGAYLVCDTVFVLCYGRVLSWLLGWGTGWRRPVLLLMTLDLLENLAAVAYGRPPRYADQWAYLIRFLTEAKWVATVVVALVLLRHLFGAGERGRRWRANLGLVARALYLHRLSVLPLVPVVVLALTSGMNLLDELPDVQRRWIDNWTGLWHGTAALLVLLALSAGLFVLGRLRSEFARMVAEDLPFPDHAPHASRPLPVLWIYWLGPALVGLGAALNRFELVDWWWLLAFVVVPIAVAVLSWVFRRRGWAGPRPARPALDPADVPGITLTGDVLAVAPLVIGGLALVRSFTPVVALGPLDGPDETLSDWWLALALTLLGVAGATGSWSLGRRLVGAVMSRGTRLGRALTVGAAEPMGGEFRFVKRWRVRLLAFWLAVFVVLDVFPLWVAGPASSPVSCSA